MTPRPRDAGETLLEVVISIAIMGIAFVALLGGMLTASSMSGLHREQADGHLLLVSTVEQVKAAGFVDCAGSGSYPNPDPAHIVETVEHWNGVDFGPTCFETVVPYYTMQRITVVVTSADGRVSRTETILKRR